MLNFLRHGKKGKQLINFPCASFFFFLAVPFSYFKRLSPVSLWLKIMKNFCSEGFSLKTLKLQSIVPAVWGFWSWIISRGEEWEREGQHFCLGHKATFILCLSQLLWFDIKTMITLIVFCVTFLSHHSFLYVQMSGERASHKLYVCMRVCVQVCIRVCILWRNRPGGAVVKNPPAKQETQVPSLGQEDLLEKEMAAHSSIFAWKIPQTEEPGMLQSLGLQSQTWFSDWAHTHAFYRFFSALLAKVACHTVMSEEAQVATDACWLLPLCCSPRHHTQHTCTVKSAPTFHPVQGNSCYCDTEASEQGGSRSRKEEVWDSMASVFCHFLETWVAQAQTTTVRSNCKYSREIFRTSGHLLHCDRAQDIKWGVERRRNGKWPITQFLMDFC